MPPPRREAWPQWLRPALIAAGVAIILLGAVILLRSEPENPLRQTTALQDGSEAPGDQIDSPRSDRAARELAGFWEIYVPVPQVGTVRWIMEFRADGTYQFTDTSNGARHEGTYRSESGQWSLAGRWSSNPLLAPGTPFDDLGTYRLLAPDTLELTGRYGVGVWKKAANAR